MSIKNEPTTSGHGSGGEPSHIGGPPVAYNRLGGRPSVASACGPCKRSHLACDVTRPCNRCVKLGKADQCEDVPHKKRGRPKASRNSKRPSDLPRSSESSDTSWWAYNNLTSSQEMLGPGLASPRQPELFELFTSTEFKILRATSACYPLTGFHPHEYVNISLFDFIHPEDRAKMDSHRTALITPPFSNATLESDRDTQAALTTISEKELLTPAGGMPQPYPNDNIRVLRNNGSFEWFNARLHLGGGAGGSLLKPETFGRIYFVVSLLHLTPSPSVDESPSSPRSIGMSPSGPLTPATSSTSSRSHIGSVSGNLPGFSAIVAAAQESRPSGHPSPAQQSPIQQSPHGSLHAPFQQAPSAQRISIQYPNLPDQWYPPPNTSPIPNIPLGPGSPIHPNIYPNIPVSSATTSSATYPPSLLPYSPPRRHTTQFTQSGQHHPFEEHVNTARQPGEDWRGDAGSPQSPEQRPGWNEYHGAVQLAPGYPPQFLDRVDQDASAGPSKRSL